MSTTGTYRQQSGPAETSERTPNRQFPGRILYGFLFTVLLPVLLVIWARMLDGTLQLTAVGEPAAGLLLAGCGALIMGAGMAALIIYGKGLPMNAYPPLHFVTRGVYRYLPHPIYTGFCLLCIGIALATSSAAGLWIVSPVVILGCVALVAGYEHHDLRSRFPLAESRPLLHLPVSSMSPPTTADRISVYVLVFFPWIVLYEAVRALGIPPDAVTAYLPFEHRLPVYEWTEVFYGGTYLFVLLAPLVATTGRSLREFALSGLIATGIVILLFLTLPLIAPPRPFIPQSLAGEILMWERQNDTPAAAFPSFHVIWAFLAARLYTRSYPSPGLLWWGVATAMALSCITTGMHAIVDVAGGVLAFLLIDRRQALWRRLRLYTERLANSWREWRVGPVRIINHGLYAGAGAFAGLSIAGTLLGPGSVVPILLVGSCAVVTAAIWAQVVEGSPSLLRPYGWYGGLLGTLAGALLSAFAGADPGLVLAAFCVAAPWIQSAGRLRCLVQGCCHGRQAPADIGIHYTHPRSRVCRLAHLGGVSLHPTPLYSILWNFVIALITARLWFLHAPALFIIGIYLILSSLGRFVEEAYRGEPQTHLYAGLRLYQWLAVAGTLAGIAATMIDSPVRTPAPELNSACIIAAGCFAVFAAFAFGVDFPHSNRRFARLT